METDDSNQLIHYLFLLQADKDNLAYKVCALSPSMRLGEKNISEIYADGGGAALQIKMTEYFGLNINYYAQFKTASFVQFTEKLGSFIYNSNEKIRFSGGSGDDKYTIHIDEGESTIKGRDIANLLRYFSQEKENYEAENELILRAVTQLFNEENLEKDEQLFRLFIKSVKTDITVRDFENGKDAVYVFCQLSNDITLYTVQAQVDETNTLVPSSAQEIKSYFNK
jgi:anionic cell wall polymer biosynthesis LytR-Cps2A-Psr (LCP) family protein